MALPNAQATYALPANAFTNYRYKYNVATGALASGDAQKIDNLYMSSKLKLVYEFAQTKTSKMHALLSSVTPQENTVSSGFPPSCLLYTSPSPRD